MKLVVLAFCAVAFGSSAFGSVNCTSRVGFTDQNDTRHVAAGPSVAGAYTTNNPIDGKIPGYNLKYFVIDDGDNYFDIMMGDAGYSPSIIETQTNGLIKGNETLTQILKNSVAEKPSTCRIDFFAVVCAETADLAEKKAGDWKFAQVDSANVPVGCEISDQ